jgi:UDP-2-acetamido-3-amino-2,3-dideoxy-glucuronate N-acetyltransferase
VQARRNPHTGNNVDQTPFFHPTATIDAGATVGAFTAVWHYSHVERTARIGENCNLGQNTYVGNNAIVGNACRIGNSVSIFSHVELGDFVFCAPFMVFTHIGFPRAAVNRHSVFEKTLIGTGATLGANSTVVPGITVGDGAFLGAGAVLTKSCRPWSMLLGVPARQVGWVSAFGERIPLDIRGAGEWVCPHTGDRYVLQDEEMHRQPGRTDILRYVPGEKLRRQAV